MEENTRTIDELISLYTLESELFDLYVEGINDKLLIDNYLSYKSSDLQVIEISNLDFTGITFEDLDFTSNKDKLIALSRVFLNNNISAKIQCLVDTDFDGILSKPEKNKFLIRTDYSCTESYYLCRNIIQKFIEIAIRRFPFDTDHLMNEIGKALKGLFIIRLVKLKFNLNSKLLKIENNLNVCKSDGCVNFNFNEYLEKFIIANNLKSKRVEIFEFISHIESRLDSDIRYNMNGHDFIEILYLYINKIKSSTGLKLDTFERVFLASLQPNHFERFPLFKLLA